MQRVLGVEAPAIVGGAVPAGDLGQEDRGLGSLALAEQHRVVARRRLGGPVRQQLARVRRHAIPVARPPPLDLAADVVDQRVLLASLSGRVEVKRLLLDLAALATGRDRDERLARPAARKDDAGRTVRPDLEVRLGRVVRPVENRIGEVSRGHIRRTLVRHHAIDSSSGKRGQVSVLEPPQRLAVRFQRRGSRSMYVCIPPRRGREDVPGMRFTFASDALAARVAPLGWRESRAGSGARRLRPGRDSARPEPAQGPRVNTHGSRPDPTIPTGFKVAVGISRGVSLSRRAEDPPWIRTAS